MGKGNSGRKLQIIGVGVGRGTQSLCWRRKQFGLMRLGEGGLMRLGEGGLVTRMFGTWKFFYVVN